MIAAKPARQVSRRDTPATARQFIAGKEIYGIPVSPAGTAEPCVPLPSRPCVTHRNYWISIFPAMNRRSVLICLSGTEI